MPLSTCSGLRVILVAVRYCVQGGAIWRGSSLFGLEIPSNRLRPTVVRMELWANYPANDGGCRLQPHVVKKVAGVGLGMGSWLLLTEVYDTSLIWGRHTTIHLNPAFDVRLRVEPRVSTWTNPWLPRTPPPTIPSPKRNVAGRTDDA
jgi:hypothetical protein